jgi:hypothetical protein
MFLQNVGIHTKDFAVWQPRPPWEPNILQQFHCQNNDIQKWSVFEEWVWALHDVLLLIQLLLTKKRTKKHFSFEVLYKSSLLRKIKTF